ncbi:UvrABC system protein A [Candidatus Kinetoplastibacterium sorsogonicusi]|uniref:UvrABC system protein A n=1 Tax=Candidatus Kinetoplastidibacterium kentomonadis TaxID=1576550 RepID=A0A3S7JAD7_9PROT|nr:excinuclease ABC subunit UvrA [Candidatus Kinetoplastibacterium sorsogonicusi]AWD32638.1 UvrABC system protein A [Candidatus Kinetoplastibacterium sorsogonicusi]
MQNSIEVYGAKQNNLKNIDISIKKNQLIVITGVSGSGKSSFALETIHAESNRLYIETFSTYIKQFLDKINRPNVTKINGLQPSIAISNKNQIKNFYHTIGSITDINMYVRLLFLHKSKLFCKKCKKLIKKYDTNLIISDLQSKYYELKNHIVFITFPIIIPENFYIEDILSVLLKIGYSRIFYKKTSKEFHVFQISDILENITNYDIKDIIYVIQYKSKLPIQIEKDHFLLENINKSLDQGKGKILIFFTNNDVINIELNYSNSLYCSNCNIHYNEVNQNCFSFHSPVGACEYCKGFGHTIEPSLDLIIPNQNLTIKEGAIKLLQIKSHEKYKNDLLKFLKKFNIPLNIPWKDLYDSQKTLILYGEKHHDTQHNFVESWENYWYGIIPFFHWLETKSYKIQIKVLLSKYKKRILCTQCKGTRIKNEFLLWRIGSKNIKLSENLNEQILDSNKILNNPNGLNINDIMSLEIFTLYKYIHYLYLHDKENETHNVYLDLLSRLQLILDFGLGYLNLNRTVNTLSSGELQKIIIIKSLGNNLTNTIFIIDEPSTGLHNSDIDKLIKNFHKLRSNNNTVIVIDNNPKIILSADTIIEIGPGPGKDGGNIVFNGDIKNFINSNTLTAQYIKKEKLIVRNIYNFQIDQLPKIIVQNICVNNLKNIKIELPIGKLTCITGISGSGKSTLINNVISKILEKSNNFICTSGIENIKKVILVDQSKVINTKKSIIATYIKVYDLIRKLFAQLSTSIAKGYTQGSFSFNTGNERCLFCNGIGYENIDIKFISDIHCICPECNGTRFQSDILNIKLENLKINKKANISEVLNMSISEAVEFFTDINILKKLRKIQDIGLGYILLGQSLTTLSDGELQRLKLITYISNINENQKDSLFIFDEPTKGLHFEDINNILSIFYDLLKFQNTIIVVEHNLDFIKISDWIIELGPGSGLNGGEVVATGKLDDIINNNVSLTGLELKKYIDYIDKSSILNQKYINNIHKKSINKINIINAYANNLKNINVKIPLGCLNVITGVSGSGKSSLAFDIIFNEGKKKYLNTISLNKFSVIKPLEKSKVQDVLGIPPTIALKQHHNIGNCKSTISTLTDIYYFFKLLYSKLGLQICNQCNKPVFSYNLEQIIAFLLKKYKNKIVIITANLVADSHVIYDNIYKKIKNYSSDYILIDNKICSASSYTSLINNTKKHTIDIIIEKILINIKNKDKIINILKDAIFISNGIINIYLNINDQNNNDLIVNKNLLLFDKCSIPIKKICLNCNILFPELTSQFFSFNSRYGWCTNCLGTGIDNNQSLENNEENLCTSCNGSRLNVKASNVTFQNVSINKISDMTIKDLFIFLGKINIKNKREKIIYSNIFKEIKHRLKFMIDMGLDYLKLNRSINTLSGGELQRVKLASYLGLNLEGICYILDEPTIGLHSIDTKKLLKALYKLIHKGNTLIVVEHDEDIIKNADHVIDIGPYAGQYGGNIIFQGNPINIKNSHNSITGKYLNKEFHHFICKKDLYKYSQKDTSIIINNINFRNLKNLNIKFLLNNLCVVTGVSGSGKSTLVNDILVKNLIIYNNKIKNFFGCKDLVMNEDIKNIIKINQSSIGKNSKSCPATYMEFWDDIRQLFSNTNQAKINGWNIKHFSFNTGEGRCKVCDGYGYIELEMIYLPNTSIECYECHGKRFSKKILEIKVHNKNIDEILNMEISDALNFFTFHKKIYNKLHILKDFGLGYLKIGQSSKTLSGGESQRLKLAYEISKFNFNKDKNINNLYILDEPTIGLSMYDVINLINILKNILKYGNSTIIVIEHNLELIYHADWIIDLGPGGGDKGGNLMFQDNLNNILYNEKYKSHTKSALIKYIKNFK